MIRTNKYNTKKYDYLIVGAGPFGSIFAYEAAKFGKRSLIVEKRPHIGGNMYTHTENGITVHDYGAHIFHTDNKEVWNFVNKFADFNNYQNQVIANYQGELYNLPFNMNTFYEMWGVKTPAEAKAKIEEQKKEAGISGQPRNLEEQAISLIGTDIYRKLIKGYTEKQWGRKATELPAFIIKRLPVRFIIRKSNGAEKQQNYRPSLLSVCRSDLFLTIIISIIAIRVFQLAVIPSFLTNG